MENCLGQCGRSLNYEPRVFKAITRCVTSLTLKSHFEKKRHFKFNFKVSIAVVHGYTVPT